MKTGIQDSLFAKKSPGLQATALASAPLSTSRSVVRIGVRNDEPQIVGFRRHLFSDNAHHKLSPLSHAAADDSLPPTKALPTRSRTEVPEPERLSFSVKNPALLSVAALMIAFTPGMACAQASHGESAGIIELMANLTFQLGIIVLVARISSKFFERLRFPTVLGELLLGILIGPYLLGSVGILGFPEGFFPLVQGSTIPVSSQLYSIATIASIILLFASGLETDLTLLLRFSVAGAAVGIGGVVASFATGAATGSLILGTPISDPANLFLGVISTATSVGITARILSERRKMDSPEGVTILAGAVIDDVLGIIILAIITGLTVAARGSINTNIEWRSIEIIALRAIVVWLGFTVVGLLLARKIGAFIKSFHSVSSMIVLALGLALILAGIFERAGLAMIIGAYVAGLTLSRTDISLVLRDAMAPIYSFFVPVFFVVMGMLVNLHDLTSPKVLLFGLIYSVVAILAKIVGCGVPSLFLNFNRLGALRIGVGMVPRGEVALIVAGIGLSAGVISHSIFGASILMTLVTTMFAPPILSLLLKKGSGTRRDVEKRNATSTVFNFGSQAITELLSSRIIQYFSSEGFYVHSVQIDSTVVYQIRKDPIFINATLSHQGMTFETNELDVIFVKTIVYEALLQLNDTISKAKDLVNPETLRAGLTDSAGRPAVDVGRILDSRCIVPQLKSQTKIEVIDELLSVLDKNGMIRNKEEARKAVFDREQSMSTGMQYGVAIPHGKTDAASKITVAVGLSREGIEFQSLDGALSKIFVLVISPQNISGPHIQFLASLAALLNKESAREALLKCKDRESIYWFFRRGLEK